MRKVSSFLKENFFFLWMIGFEIGKGFLYNKNKNSNAEELMYERD